MAAETDELLTQDGKLKARIELRDAQEGFAGVTGEVLAVEPSGAWTLQRFLNKKLSEPHDKGQFSADDLKAIAGALATQQLAKLPAQFGRDARINRHLISLQVGEAKTTLVLNGGESFSQASVGDDDANAALWRRFKASVQAIDSRLKKASPPKEGVPSPAATEGYIKVEAKGVLRSMRLETKDGALTLDAGARPELRERLKGLEGTVVTLMGDLRIAMDDQGKPGVLLVVNAIK